MGAVKEVKEILSWLPLCEIESLECKRLGAAGVITIVANGSEFKVEAKAGGAKDFAEAFARVRSAS